MPLGLALALGLGLSPATALESAGAEVTYKLDRETVTLETHSATVGEALQEHGFGVGKLDAVQPSPSTEVTDDLAVSVIYSKTVRLKVGRKAPRRVQVPALTVAGALSEAGVKTSRLDRVKPGRNSALEDNSSIKVTRVKYKRFAERHPIKFKTVKKKAPNLYKGTVKTAKKGKVGREKRVFKRKFINGKRVSTKRIGTKTLRKPVNKLVLVGTKARPGLSGVWKALAQCESGGNASIVSSNGLYHGLFQFSVSTWHSVGGKGLPSKASPAEQLKRAKILQARSGWGQWPHCSHAIGVR